MRDFFGNVIHVGDVVRSVVYHRYSDESNVEYRAVVESIDSNEGYLRVSFSGMDKSKVTAECRGHWVVVLPSSILIRDA